MDFDDEICDMEVESLAFEPTIEEPRARPERPSIASKRSLKNTIKPIKNINKETCLKIENMGTNNNQNGTSSKIKQHDKSLQIKDPVDPADANPMKKTIAMFATSCSLKAVKTTNAKTNPNQQMETSRRV